MNMKFNCGNCGHGMTATIWDESVHCPECGTEYLPDIKRLDGTVFEWSWVSDEEDLDPMTGRQADDLSFSEYVKTADTLANLVRNRQATGDLLTVKDAGELFDLTWDTVLSMAEDHDLNLNVGVQVGGLGGPTGSIPMADWTMEDLDAYDQIHT